MIYRRLVTKMQTKCELNSLHNICRMSSGVLKKQIRGIHRILSSTLESNESNESRVLVFASRLIRDRINDRPFERRFPSILRLRIVIRNRRKVLFM